MRKGIADDLPKPVTLETDSGRYKTDDTMQDDRLIYQQYFRGYTGSP